MTSILAYVLPDPVAVRLERLHDARTGVIEGEPAIAFGADDLERCNRLRAGRRPARISSFFIFRGSLSLRGPPS